MDRAIPKKKWAAGRLVLIAACVAVVGVLAYQVLSHSGRTRLRVDATRVTVSPVQFGEFVEYYPFNGTVEPLVSVYLDLEQGGRVDEILAEGGHFIKEGELILKLSNANLERSFITTETSLLENLDRARNTQFSVEQSKLSRREQLLDLDYQILDLQKQHERNLGLRKNGGVISDQAFEEVLDQLNYRKDRRHLLEERMEREDFLNQQQLDQANESIRRLQLSLELLAKTVESLNVRAPISGYLSGVNAQLGQNLNAGQRIGQIDVPGDFKVRVEIDQYYLSKVDVGTPGRFTLDGRTYELSVEKKYEEVADAAFRVDMKFVGDVPQGLQRGQTLTIEMQFSEPGRSLMVAKGGFYQQTSGRWAYVLSEDAESAHRTDIRLGRQNPRFVEVLEGLREGDQIITSGYEAFNSVDELVFAEPIPLTK